MKRRAFLGTLLAPLTAAALPNPKNPIVDAFNAHVYALRDWRDLWTKTPYGGYSWAARHQWDTVRETFHDVDVLVRNE